MDSTIKSLTITGSAAEDATRFRQKAASRKKRVVKDEDDSTFIENAKKFVTGTTAVAIKEPVKESVVIQKPIQVIQKPVITEPQESNVILKPPKQARVKLQPKSVHPTPQLTDHTTRKARRFKLSVGNLTHRFTRAKKVKDDTEKKPMNSIRDYLVERGVIQTKSKAPEKMLRSMYSDFMLLKDQAL
jgi:hypothetical protein